MKVAVIGATGLVGQKMLQVLAEQNLHIDEIIVAASDKSIGKKITYKDKEITLSFDNDEAGLIDGEKLSESTGFINIVLPKFEGGKDVSDYYKVLNDKDIFKQNILTLFNHEQKRIVCESK